MIAFIFIKNVKFCLFFVFRPMALFFLFVFFFKFFIFYFGVISLDVSHLSPIGPATCITIRDQQISKKHWSIFQIVVQPKLTLPKLCDQRISKFWIRPKLPKIFISVTENTETNNTVFNCFC
jgi:hypothetical protein